MGAVLKKDLGKVEHKHLFGRIFTLFFRLVCETLHPHIFLLFELFIVKMGLFCLNVIYRVVVIFMLKNRLKRDLCKIYFIG